MKSVFSEADRERIRAAVQAAEARCGAELVPAVEPDSDDYEAVPWKLAALLTLFMLVALMALHQFTDALLWWPLPLFGLLILLAGAVGYMLPRWSQGIRRRLIHANRLEFEVDRSAHELFHELGVSNTTDRMGILLYFSLFERRLEILPDVGYHLLTDQQRWQTLVDECTQFFRANSSVTDAVIASINACADVVEALNPEGSKTTNELDDNLRLDED